VQASPLVNSIAEGDLVRSTNDMYKEYGVGRVQKMRNGLAKIEFNPSAFLPRRGRMRRGPSKHREDPSCRFLS
jgi:hypothetical protein